MPLRSFLLNFCDFYGNSRIFVENDQNCRISSKNTCPNSIKNLENHRSLW